MIDVSHGPRQNHLLDALPREQWERWQSHLEFIDMRLGAVLYEPGIAGPSRGRSCECYSVVKDEYERLLPVQLAA
jgi:hypothetical protein